MSDIDIGKLSDREILVLLASGQKTINDRLSNHGERLRALETFRNVLAGGGTVIAAVVAALKLTVLVKAP